MEDEERRYECEKSESPFILVCGPHFLSFSLSVMTRCGTHALVRCVTNEGVLTFRCFPSKSQFKKQTFVHWERRNGHVLHDRFISWCSWREHSLIRGLEMFLCGRRNLNCLFQGANKRLVSFQTQSEDKQVRALHEGSTEAGRQTSERHMRRVRDVFLSLLWVHVAKPPRQRVSAALVPWLIPAAVDLGWIWQITSLMHGEEVLFSCAA